ncbi:exosortase C-terminal domain/associated protein EpsI [Lentisalinibacter sediminis]|uniref:exosortase C-terminal domain/associated protein EpsI n=1 Tax=Lentisalinibacter sediminis TaxID=2992237 RepID=UPI00386F1D9E
MAAVLGVAIVAFWPTVFGLWQKWTNDPSTYGHGPLVSLISGALLVLRASQLRIGGAFSSTSWLLLTATLTLSVMAWAAQASLVQVVAAFLLPLVLLGAGGVLYGVSGLKRLTIPALYLWFAVPFWFLFNYPLQRLTIVIASVALQALGIPVVIEGAMVHLPNGSFEIASGCAGLNFFVVAFAIAMLYGYLFLSNRTSSLVFIALAIVASVVANWIRVVTVIIVGYLTDMQHYLVAVDHYYFGWLIFVLVFSPLLYIGLRLERHTGRADTSNTAPASANNSSSKTLRRVMAALGAIALVPGISSAVIMDRPESVRLQRLSFESDISLLGKAEISWFTSFAGASDEIKRSVQRNHVPLDVYRVVYTRQEQGRELVSQENSLFDSTKWQSRPEEYNVIDDVQGLKSIRVLRLELEGRNHHRSGIVLYWYFVGAHTTIRPWEVKARELIAKITSGAPSGLIAIRYTCIEDCHVYELEAKEFIRENAQILMALDVVRHAD